MPALEQGGRPRAAGAELLSDPNTRMFLGTLDDSVSRYPWLGMQPTVDYLNRLLIFHVLLGPRLCSRMGNILFFPPYRAALFHEDMSPLIELCRSGFFQIQMNGPTFNESIARRQASSTLSALTFIAETGWAPGSETFKRMEALERSLVRGNGFTQYDVRFHEAFKQNMVAISGLGNPDFDVVYEKWSRLPKKQRTRTNFESIAMSLRGNARFDAVAAMRFANSANHYAYGRAMTGGSANILVETQEVPIFDSMTSTLFGPEERVMQVERYDQLILSGTFDVISKHLRMPKVLFYRADIWNDFARMTRPSDQRNENLNNHKRGLIEIVNAIIRSEEGTEQNALKERLADHCRSFSDFVARSLGIKVEGSYVPVSLKLSLQRQMKSTGKVFGTAMGAAAGLGSGSLAAGVAVKTAFEFGFDKTGEKMTRYIDSQRVSEDDLERIRPEVVEVARAFSYPSIKIMEARLPQPTGR